MFRISKAVGIEEDSHPELYELSSKVITITLLKEMEDNKFRFDLSHNEFLKKVDEDVRSGFVAAKLEHLLKMLNDNTIFYTPDIFEELLINETFNGFFRFKPDRVALKELVIKELGNETFEEWKSLLKKYCSELFYYEDVLTEDEIKKEQNKRYRQIYNMCLEPSLSYKDMASENCGVLFWDYDFEFFYEKGFWKTIEMWLIVGECRGYGMNYICEMLETGGFHKKVEDIITSQ